jgi:hypothetical protein
MAHIRETPDDGTTLDLWEHEDTELLALFDQISRRRDPSVEQRAERGDEAKQVVRHVANREAALTDVARALHGNPELADVADGMTRRTEQRRTCIDRVEHMSRGVPSLQLNQGQDFDGALAELTDLLQAEITWDVSTAIPTIRHRTDRSTRNELFHSARHATRHAPTNLSPRKSRWYERAPIVSRLLTVYDHWRDYPKATGEWT